MIEPFDIESRARELIEVAPTMGYPFSAGNPVLKTVAERIAIQLARETAEAIAKEIEGRAALIHSANTHAGLPDDPAEMDALASAGAIARSHARPPEPAPETREERYRKALEEIAGPSSARVMHGKGCSCVACKAWRALEQP